MEMYKKTLSVAYSSQVITFLSQDLGGKDKDKEGYAISFGSVLEMKDEQNLDTDLAKAGTNSSSQAHGIGVTSSRLRLFTPGLLIELAFASNEELSGWAKELNDLLHEKYSRSELKRKEEIVSRLDPLIKKQHRSLSHQYACYLDRKY